MSERYLCDSHAPRPAHGGAWYCIEVVGAFADGSSRHDGDLWVSHAEDAGDEEIALAVLEAMDRQERSRERVAGEKRARGVSLDSLRGQLVRGREPAAALESAARKKESP